MPAMDLYSVQDWELDGRDLKGGRGGVMSCVGGLRDAYTRLADQFAGLKNPAISRKSRCFLPMTRSGRTLPAALRLWQSLSLVLKQAGLCRVSQR